MPPKEPLQWKKNYLRRFLGTPESAVTCQFQCNKMLVVPAHCTTSVRISQNVRKSKLPQHAKHNKNVKTQFAPTLKWRTGSRFPRRVGQAYVTLQSRTNVNPQAMLACEHRFYQRGWHDWPNTHLDKWHNRHLSWCDSSQLGDFSKGLLHQQIQSGL